MRKDVVGVVGARCRDPQHSHEMRGEQATAPFLSISSIGATLNAFPLANKCDIVLFHRTRHFLRNQTVWLSPGHWTMH